MPPHSAYFTTSVTLDINCQNADPCYQSSKGPLSATVVEPVVYETHKQHKTVSFHEVVKAKKTIHISDFSAEEIRSCWYKDEDYEVMKRDVRFEVNLLENDCLVENQSVMTRTARGLGIFSSSTAGRIRRETKRRACNAVLEEQRLQREEGSYDPEFIAEIYSILTKTASNIAIDEAAC